MDWKDISISKYLKINDIIEDVNIIDEDKMIEIANIIFNEDITELPLYECKKKIKELSFINTEAPKEKLAKQYVVNDTKYNSSADVTSILANLFIDFQNYTKNKDIIGCISCFFIPDGHKYNDGYDMIKVKKDIGDLPITVANGLTFFFKTLYVILLVLSQRYSLSQMKKAGMSKEKIEEMTDSLATLGIANLEYTLFSLSSAI